MIITSLIYLPTDIDVFCMADKKGQTIPDYVLNSDEVKKYLGHNIETNVSELTILPPKMSYEFKVVKGNVSELLTRINDVCIDDGYFFTLACRDTNKIYYEIYQKQDILDMLEEQHCFLNTC